MADSLPLPPRFMPRSTDSPRHSSIPPSRQESNKLTKESSPVRSLPSPTRRGHSPFNHPIAHGRSDLPPLVHSSPLSRRISSSHLSPDSPDSSGSAVDRQHSAPTKQLAHQLAAEALLTMAPAGSSNPSKSPENRDPAASVPAPAGRVTPSIEDPRGIKRKNEEEDQARARPSPSYTLNVPNAEKDKPKDRAFSHSPLANTDPKPQPPQNSTNANGQPGRVTPTHSSLLGPGHPSRYSIYGLTARDAIANSPWAALSQRYSSLGLRRDMPSAASNPAKPLSPPRRASPDPLNRDNRFYPGQASTPASGPSAMTGYGHYAMGRKELAEHREQLRDGKRWLEAMMIKTDKMLHMVENKMALAPSDLTSSAASGNNLPSTSIPGKHSEDWEFEERERARQKEFDRLEAEREKEKQERDKRERERLVLIERERERERERDREHVGGTSMASFFGMRGRERSEAERNRDLLLASRRVTAVSPSGRERSTPGAPPPTTNPTTNSSTANGATNPNKNPSAANGNGTNGPATNGDKPTPDQQERKNGAWDGGPVMSGVALPRREQGLRLGRGLWSFDVRG